MQTNSEVNPPIPIHDKPNKLEADMGSCSSAGQYADYQSVSPSQPYPTLTKPTVSINVKIETMDDLWKLAEWASQTGFCPKEMRGRPIDAFMCMLYGLEVGLLPIQALFGIAIINGRPTIWGDAMLALCLAHPTVEDIQEELYNDPEQGSVAKCKVIRKGRKPVIKFFSQQDAEKAGLWNNPKKDPWLKYPQRMLGMRARSWALRDSCSDILKGLIAQEEAWDIPAPEALPEPTNNQATQAWNDKNIQPEHRSTHNFYQMASQVEPQTTTKPRAATEPTEQELKQLERDLLECSQESQDKFWEWMKSHGFESIMDLRNGRFASIRKNVDEELTRGRIDKRANVIKLTEKSDKDKILLSWIVGYKEIEYEVKVFNDLKPTDVNLILSQWEEIKTAYKKFKPISKKQYQELLKEIKLLGLAEEKVLEYLNDRDLMLESLNQLPISKLEQLKTNIQELAKFSESEF